MYFELINNFINKEKWREIDIDTSGFQENYHRINLNIKDEIKK